MMKLGNGEADPDQAGQGSDAHAQKKRREHGQGKSHYHGQPHGSQPLRQPGRDATGEGHGPIPRSGSISPEMMTMVMPKAMIPGMETFRRTLSRLTTVKKPSA